MSPASFATDTAAKTGLSERTIGVDMLPLLQAEAKERQQKHSGTAPGRPSETLSTDLHGVLPKGRAADIAGAAVDVSGRVVWQAKTVKTADPEAFERIELLHIMQNFRPHGVVGGLVAAFPGRLTIL